MIERFERYLDGKGLVLNVEKTKVMRFSRGGGRWKNGDVDEKGRIWRK